VGAPGPPPGSRFLFEERFEPGAGVYRHTRLRRRLFTNSEELTKIPSCFVEDWIHVGFATGIGVVGIVEGAVQAAPQVSPAARAGITPTEAVCADNRVLALMAGLHSCILSADYTRLPSVSTSATFFGEGLLVLWFSLSDAYT